MRAQKTVGRMLLPAAAAALLAIGAIGCRGDGPDVAGDVCRKSDSCQALSGITAAQCKYLINTSICSRSGAGQSDLENAFRACVDGLMQGGGAGTGGIAAGGTTGTGGSGISGAGGSAVGGAIAGAGG